MRDHLSPRYDLTLISPAQVLHENNVGSEGKTVQQLYSDWKDETECVQGAVEDGVRGQCRDDSDCTPWAPSCSPLGYCRGGVQVSNISLLRDTH